MGGDLHLPTLPPIANHSHSPRVPPDVRSSKSALTQGLIYPDFRGKRTVAFEGLSPSPLPD